MWTGSHRRPQLHDRWLLHAGARRAPGHLTVANPLTDVSIPRPEVVWYEPVTEDLPHVGSRLGWRVGGDHMSPRIDRCLSAFVRLADADDRKIVAFAEKWGSLGLCVCSHGGSDVHLGCRGLGKDERSWSKDGLEQGRWYIDHSANLDDPMEARVAHWEPLAAWRFYARAYRALLNLAVDLRVGRASKPEEWRDAYTRRGNLEWDRLADPMTWENRTFWPKLTNPAFNPSPEERRDQLCALITAQLRAARVQPQMVWKEETPQIVLSLDAVNTLPSGTEPWPGPRLYSVLACQLAAAVLSSSGVYRCAHCGQPFEANRRARADYPAYCKDEDCQRERTRLRVSRSRSGQGRGAHRR